jgi:nucleoside-diphosphate kinase
MERTLCIVKPDGVEKQAAGKILSMIEDAGLRLVAVRMMRLTPEQAGAFYAVHRERPFYDSLITFMTSGPVLAAVLEGQDAIARWRTLMGPTNSTDAPKGTIRGEFGTDVERNAVHGSDAPETAAVEVGFFFRDLDLCG